MTRRKILLISIPLFMLLCGIVGYFFISSEYFLNTYIKVRLTTALKEQINEDYKVDIIKLRGNVLTGVVVENFSIFDNSSELPILSTEQIILKYNILGLIRRKFLVTKFEIDSPILNIVRQPDGHDNLSKLFQKSSPNSDPKSDNDFAFAVSSFKISGGEINYVDKHEKIEVSLPEITVKLSGQLDEWNHSGSFSIGKGNILLNGAEIPIERIHDVEFALTTNSGELQPVLLKIGNSYINVKQFKRNWSNELWDTRVEINVDASDVEKILNINTHFTGAGKVILDLNGTDSTLLGTLSVTSDSLTIQNNIGTTIDNSDSKSRKIEITDLEFNTILELDDEPNIILEKFSIQIAGGTLSGNGKAIFDSSIQGKISDRIQQFIKHTITYDSHLTISNIELSSLLSMIVEIPKDVPEVESGIISGEAQINGDTAEIFALESRVELSDTNLLVNGNPDPITVSASTLMCEITSERSKGSNLTANGVIDESKVEI